MLQVVCTCGKRFSAGDEHRGKRSTCPHCGQSLVLSGGTAVATASIASEAEQTLAPRLAPVQESLPADAPQKIGKYKIVRKLGQGAMGVVWLAHDPLLMRDVAIKVLPEEIAGDQERLKRFVREARSAARLNHPHTVTIYDIGAEDRQAYIVMELVDGGSLDDSLRLYGPLDWRAATRAVRDVAAGLAAAHELGLVHRDIKPANLMRTKKGVTKIADFGLVSSQDDAQLTQSGMFVGTPAYMAPEQARGAQPDARGDLYSLTCTFYALLVGRAPFDAPTAPGLMYQHVHEPFPDPRTTVGGLPEPVCRILARGAQKDPAQRYQKATAMHADLEAALAGDSPAAPIVIVRSTGSIAANPAFQSALPPARRVGASLGSALGRLASTDRIAAIGRERRRSSRPPWLWLAGGAGLLLLAAIIFVETNGRKTNDGTARDAETVVSRVERIRDKSSSPSTPPQSADPGEATSLPHEVEETEESLDRESISRLSNKPWPPKGDPDEAEQPDPTKTDPRSVKKPAKSKRPRLVPKDAILNNGHWYWFSANKVTPEQAQLHAFNLNGRLVTITSADENTFVAEHVKGPMLLGMLKVKGVWMNSAGFIQGYFNWDRGQPSSAQNEIYAAIHFNGVWHDFLRDTLLYCIEWGNE